MDKKTKLPKKHTRDDIIMEAGKLFAKQGFDTTTMAGIAGHVGIEKASLYYFFKNKDELFGAVLDKVWGGLADHLKASPFLARSGNIKKNFTSALVYIIKTAATSGLSVLRLDARKGDPSICAHKTREHIAFMRKELLVFLKSQKVPNPEMAENLVVNAVHGYVIRAQLEQEKLPAEKFGQYIADLILKKQ